MIRKRYTIKVRGEEWRVTVFFPLTCYHMGEIMGELARMRCSQEDMNSAMNNLMTGQRNNGLTYSNYTARESIVVFALSDNPKQYFNLIVHELHHLSVHIAEANGIPLTSEAVCYINGDIAMKMYDLVSRLFCYKEYN